MKQYAKWLGVLTVVGLLIYSWLKPDVIDESTFEQFLTFDAYSKVKQSPLIYEVSYEGQAVGYLSFGSVYGYQSDITVGAVVNRDGQVLETQVIDENETPSFIRKVYQASFLEKQFPLKLIEDGFKVGMNVEAVSSATVSSVAITKGVGEAVNHIGREFLSIDVPNYEKVQFGIVEAVLIGMLLLALLSYKLNNKCLRRLTMVYSIILLGFKYKQFIAFSWLVSAGMGKFPRLSGNLGWFILMIGTFAFIGITGKNIYCASICPFGALQRAEKQLSGLDFFKVTSSVKKQLRVMPAILAYTGFVIAVLSGQLGALSFEPFSLIFGRLGNGIQWVLLPIVLVMSLLVMGFYCNYACPVGYVLNLSVQLRRGIRSYS